MGMCGRTFRAKSGLLNGVAALGKFYLAEVPSDTRVWRRTPAIELPGPGLLGRPRTKARVVPTAQARQLVASALEEGEGGSEEALASVEYHQQRNHSAYCSHRKRTLRSQRRRSVTQKPKVSL